MNYDFENAPEPYVSPEREHLCALLDDAGVAPYLIELVDKVVEKFEEQALSECPICLNRLLDESTEQQRIDEIQMEAILQVHVDRRDPECVKRWPDCVDGEYNPSCCRFPKSCSCGPR